MSMKFRTDTWLLAAAVGAFAAGGMGCQTMAPGGAEDFAKTTRAVKAEADTALNGVAALTRESSVHYAATQSTLSEANFVGTPTGDTVGEWDAALSALESYANSLATLVSPAAGNNFDAAATNLVSQFNETAGDLKADKIQSQSGANALLAAAFTETAEAILAAREQATALRVARATDPKVARICELLAAEVGADHTGAPSLRKTLYKTVWAPRLAALTPPFLTADETKKLEICGQYADLLARRDAEDQLLAGLHRSLLALRDAHHKLAAGKSAAIVADLALVTAEIEHTHDLYTGFSSPKK